MIRSFVAVSLLVSASVAVAQTASEPAAASTEKPVKEKKICRDSDDSTSRVAKRICRTAQEWAEGRQKGAKAGQRSFSADE